MTTSFQFRLSTLLLVAAGWAMFLSIAKTFGPVGCFGFFLGLFLLARRIADRSVRRSCMVACTGCAGISLGFVHEIFALPWVLGIVVAPCGVMALLGSLKDREVACVNETVIRNDDASNGREDGME